jgi:hypothetical protein
VPAIDQGRRDTLLARYGALPLSFEPNRGQVDRRVLFLARAGTAIVLLTAREAVVAPIAPACVPAQMAPLAHTQQTSMGGPRTRDDHAGPACRAIVHLHLVGANPHAPVVALDRLPGTVNYVIGATPRSWHTNLPTYARVAYRNVYPGVDLVYHGTQQGLEYDFRLAPHVDPRVLRLAVAGAAPLRLDGRGRVTLGRGATALRQDTPVIYQQVNGRRHRIRGHAVLLDRQTIGFGVGAYDPRRPLVIDPVLTYATVFGRGGSTGTAIAVDRAGNAYVAGSAAAGTVPTTAHVVQRAPGGNATPGGGDAFIAKLNPQGSALLYATYLGGSGDDHATGLALDHAGNVYVSGTTTSRNFPITPHAWQRTYHGGSATAGGGDAFVAKVNGTGSALVYSTYLGGTGVEQSGGIAVDRGGDALVTGMTTSRNFPTTPRALWRTPHGVPCSSNLSPNGPCPDAYAARINPSGTALVYGTYLGGSGMDTGTGIAVDSAGKAYVTGTTNSHDFPVTAHALQRAYRGHGSPGATTAFVTKLTPGGRLVYSTYLGGTRQETGAAIAVGRMGEAYVTGMTGSPDFPMTAHAFQRTLGGPADAFVARLGAAGDHLVSATYLGGTNIDQGSGLAVDDDGGVYVTGSTVSRNFPTVHPLAGIMGTGSFYAFAARLNGSGSALLYSTYLGGRHMAGGDFGDLGRGIAVDASSNAYVTGDTTTTDFPATHTLPGTRGPNNSRIFVARIGAARTGA